MKKRYILTGAPNAGKTTLLTALAQRGYSTVDEAATALITQAQLNGNQMPWERVDFIDQVVTRQIAYQQQADTLPEDVIFFDRSPFCTYALCLFLEYLPTHTLLNEIDRIRHNGIYQKNVFFLEQLGFVEKTSARQISLGDCQRFERLHEQVYTDFGYTCLKLPAESTEKRLNTLLHVIRHDS